MLARNKGHQKFYACGRVAGRNAAALPLFTSEPQQDLARFARGFFRDLFSLLPKPSVIVLDNFHEARTPPAQRAALAQVWSRSRTALPSS